MCIYIYIGLFWFVPMTMCSTLGSLKRMPHNSTCGLLMLSCKKFLKSTCCQIAGGHWLSAKHPDIISLFAEM